MKNFFCIKFFLLKKKKKAREASFKYGSGDIQIKISSFEEFLQAFWMAQATDVACTISRAVAIFVATLISLLLLNILSYVCQDDIICLYNH